MGRTVDHGEAGMIRKVKALLAKAERASTKHEAAAFSAKAEELLAKYQIDRALLSDAQGVDQEEVQDRVITIDPPFAMEQLMILNAVTLALGGKAVHLSKLYSDPDGEEKLHVFGMEHDLDRIEMLFDSILVQMSNAIINGNLVAPPGVTPVEFGKGFVKGYTAEVVARLRATEERVAQQAEEERQARGLRGPSAKVALAGKKEKVEWAFKAKYPHTVAGRAAGGSYSGVSAGSAAGANADLGGARLGPARRAIGS